MHRKKYMILFPPFFLIFVLLVIFLPVNQKHYIALAPIAMWAFYYIWIFIEKKRKKIMWKNPPMKTIKIIRN